MEASPPRLPKGVPEPGGTDDFDSAPTTPLPVLGRGIPRQLRAVSPTSQADYIFKPEIRSPTMHHRSAANRPTAILHLGMVAMRQAPTVVRTAARQLGAHMSGPGGGEEIREGRTRA